MKLAIKGIAVLVIMIFVSVSCNKSDEPNSGQVEPINDDSTEVVFPIVVLDEVIEITNRSAKCKGRCINDGGSQILEKGVCWSTSNNPSVRDCHVLAQGDSLFVCEITNLEANTTYYLRAYASNSKGVSYGNEITFKTEFDHEWLDEFKLVRGMLIRMMVRTSGKGSKGIRGTVPALAPEIDVGAGLVVFAGSSGNAVLGSEGKK